MFVRLVKQHRRGGTTYDPGITIQVRDDEGMVLIQDGVAVPLRGTDVFAREVRAK